MPTRKLPDSVKIEFCRDPDHNPSSFMVYEPGHYEHTCPKCGKIQKFIISKKVYL